MSLEMNSLIKNAIVFLLLMLLLLPSFGLEAGEVPQIPIVLVRDIDIRDLIPPESAKEPQEYIIGPEDIIEVSVWRNDALSKVVTVRPDGKISLPLIGDIQASGSTASQLRDEIVKRLKVYQESPTVSVILQQVNSLNIYIIGEVAKPGQYRLKSNTTLLQAIAIAGGFTQWASKNNIVVLRNNPGSGEERIRIRYDDIISGRDKKGNILLHSGDTIIVP